MKQPSLHFLSKSERNSLESLQRRERDKRLSDCIRVILLLDNGWLYDKIATALFLDRSTIQRYYQLYINGGVQGLLALKYSGTIKFLYGWSSSSAQLKARLWLDREEKILKANTGCQWIKINGALDVDTMNMAIELTESVNAQSTISLLKQIEENYPNVKRVMIICDNARYCKSTLAKEYIKHSKIELKFLPPYSPNLNLIERVWRFMNKKIRDNIYYEKFSDFKEAVLNFFENVYSYKGEFKRLLLKNFILSSVQFEFREVEKEEKIA